MLKIKYDYFAYIFENINAYISSEQINEFERQITYSIMPPKNQIIELIYDRIVGKTDKQLEELGQETWIGFNQFNKFLNDCKCFFPLAINQEFYFQFD